jgi:hypothetical protein
MQSFSKILLVFAILLTSFSCKKETTTPEEPVTPPVVEPINSLIKIGETYIVGAKAKAVIYSTKAFVTGYNEVYVALFDSIDGSALTKGHFDIIPMMNMGMMMHSSPVENTEDTTTTNGYFKCAVVFSMAGTSSQWFLNLNFHNHKNELEGQGTLGVTVAESTPARFKSTVAALDSNAKVFISYVLPTSPKVGINDFEIVLHKKASMMDYFPIENYAVEIVPEMPSMGHGSPNNVNPTHTTNGHYKGKVNFTMTGLWQVKLKLSKNGTLLSSDQYFEITL